MVALLFVRGLLQSGKIPRKTKILLGLGKVKEFLKKSGKFFDILKVSEKLGNLLVKSNVLHTKSSQKQKEIENVGRKISMAFSPLTPFSAKWHLQILLSNAR